MPQDRSPAGTRDLKHSLTSPPTPATLRVCDLRRRTTQPKRLPQLVGHQPLSKARHAQHNERSHQRELKRRLKAGRLSLTGPLGPIDLANSQAVARGAARRGMRARRSGNEMSDGER